MHCSDYGLLTDPQVQATLASGRAQSFYQPDTNKLREIYDVGFINWSAGKDPSMSVSTRLIVACSAIPEDGGKPHSGKRQANKVYELFVTNRSAQQLSSLDLMSLYCGRGGFDVGADRRQRLHSVRRGRSSAPWGGRCR